MNQHEKVNHVTAFNSCNQYSSGYLREFFSKIPLPCVAVDQRGKILEANSNISDYLEIELNSSEALDLNNFIDKDHVLIFKEKLVSFFEKGKCQPFELKLTKSNGEVLWASVSMLFEKSPQNVKVCIIVLTDITSQKTYETKLKRVLERYRTLTDMAVVGVLLGDHYGIITETNQYMCSILGLPRKEIIGKHVSDLNFTRKSLEQNPFRFDLLHEGKTIVRERTIVQPDGKEVIVEIISKMMPDGSYQSVYHDITDRKKIETALKENEHFLRESQRAAKIGSYFTDLRTGTWKASEEMFRIFGIDETYPFTLDTWISMIHPDSRDDLIKYHIDAVAKGKQFDTEYRIVRPGTGEIRWVHGSGEFEFDENMNPVRAKGTIQDITDRKLAEEALRENEKAYRTFFENTGTSVLFIEEDMTISMANSQFIRFTGLSSENVIGRMKWTDFAYSGDLEYMLEMHKKRRESSGLDRTNYEIRFQNKEGKLCYALLNTKLIPGTKRSIASIIDITQRKKLEVKLAASEEKFKTLAEFSPVGIMLHQENFWIYVNKAASDICGYSEEELLKMNFWEIVHPEYKEFVRDTGIKRQKNVSDIPNHYEFKIICKSGEEKWVSLTGRNIKFEDNPTAMVVVMDITERKNSEQERMNLEHQLQQAQKMESIGRLAGGVAHDFNNMLGVIMGHADLALMTTEPDKSVHGNLLEIKKASERSANLTRQLLAFARKQTISPKILDLNRTLEGMLKMIRRLIGENIYLVWLPGPDIWSVKMDPSQLDQILVNLCINSRDSINGTGRLTIETENCSLDENYASTHLGFIAGDFVKISISDNGCGMDRETISHIFEPFYTTKNVNQGTGLGLATVYGAVKQNKGFINVYSEPESGSTFSIYLPRNTDGAEEQIKQPSAETTVPTNKTILLVEDEPAILDVTTMLLERLGYNILTAGTPGEAIDLAKKYTGEIDLLLTDVVMPEMNGRELAKQILLFFPNIKRMFMSGYTANVIAHHGVLDEGVHFIQKPFSATDLGEKIRNLLNED